MKEKSAISTLVVTDLEMANVLTDPEHLRYIAPFLGHERTVSEVTAETKSTLSTTYRRVKRYCELGILAVEREQKRKGKTLKVYRAVADVLFIPYRVSAGQEAVRARWRQHWEEDFQRGFRHAYGADLEEWGQRIYRKNGVFTSMLAKNPDEDLDPLTDDMPAFFSRFHDSLYLDFADAKAFQRDLEALFATYAAKTGRQRYMLRVAFVPVPEDAEVIP
ncbi:helix-turn-helix domain-containing protein [soil metagenome]